MTTTNVDPAGTSLPRGLSLLLTMAAGIIVVAGLHVMASVVAPMFLAAVVVIVLSPIYGALKKRGAPTWLASTGLFLGALGVLVAILGALAFSVIELAKLVTGDEYADDLQATRQDAADLLERFGVSGDDLSEALDQIDIGAVAGQLTSALAGVFGILSALGLLIFTLVFLAMDASGFKDSIEYVDDERPTIIGSLYSFADSTKSYFFVSTVFGLIVAVLDTVALFALGIPLAVVWGVLAFITNYIPNVGFVIGLIPPALLALFGGGWELALAVIVIYSVLNVVIQSVIQPRYVGDAVGLSATLTFVSLMFWGWILGALGALLAVPLTLLVKALLIDSDPTTKWMAPLITLQVPDDDPESDGDSDRESDGGSDSDSDSESDAATA